MSQSASTALGKHTTTARPARWLLPIVVFGLPCVTVLLPLLTFLTYSFWSMEGGRPVADFTFDNYVKFAGDPGYVGVYFSTLWMTLFVAIFALIAGYIIAYCIWRLDGPIRNILLLSSVLPLSISYIVKIYSMRNILGFSGFLNQILVWSGFLSEPSRTFLFNQTAVTISMTMIYLPFGILPIYLALDRIPRSLIAASEDLGAYPWRTFTRIVLPLSAPGAVAGGMFVMVLALGDFLTPQMVGGTSGFTFGRAVWSQFGLAFNWPFGAALAVVLLLTVAALMALANLLVRRT
ncbi:ABC transporter permease [Mesorhizobium argentiipisi]|uniref:ABC transporter permease n=1 Tax=Mesorhizobium argentiipisi TaxID=3015175 RepID=A0ABU8K9X9_9HYPH